MPTRYVKRTERQVIDGTIKRRAGHPAKLAESAHFDLFAGAKKMTIHHPAPPQEENRRSPFCRNASSHLSENVATPAGLEPATFSLEGCCSIR
jgi:hypothetical protein